MPNTLIDAIQLNVRSSANLSGLTAAENKLKSLGAALNKINGLLSGLNDGTKFERTAAGIERALKTLGGDKRRKADVADVLGFKPAELEKAINQVEKAREKAIAGARGQRRQDLQADLAKLQTAFKFEGSKEVLGNYKQAARLLMEAQQFSIKASASVENRLGRLFGAEPRASAAPAASVASNATITVSPAQLHAELAAAGHIPLIIPAERVIATLGPGAITVVAGGQATAAGGSPAAGPASRSRRSAEGVMPDLFSDEETAAGQGPLYIRGRQTSTNQKEIERRVILAKGRIYEELLKEVEGFQTLQVVQRTEVKDPMKAARYRRQILAANPSAEDKAAQEAMQNAGRENSARLRLARQRRALLSGTDQLEARRIAEEERELKSALNEGKRAMAARAKVRAQNQRIMDASEAQEMKRAQRTAIGMMQRAEHDRLRQMMTDQQARGYVFERQVSSSLAGGKRRSVETYTGTREEAGKKYRSVFEFQFENAQASTAKVLELDRALKATRAEASAAGRDFLKNTIHVTTWAASVAVLYGTLGLLKASLKSVIDTGYQMARLDQVFSKIGGTTQQVTSDVLELAAANGRSGTEAMDAAIQWSRLGLSRIEVNEAVKESLIAANVAEMTAAESTEHLSGIMMAYRLNVFQLSTVLSELNSISNHFNVTNKDLLTGISRTAAIAKQAGLPLTELMGILGATVGSTGQTGANIGNAIKSLTVGLANPALQKLLREEFKIEVTTGGGGDVKNLSEILGELFIRYQALTKAEQQHFLVAEAGKTQASRVAAILDTYIQGQALAIQAQLDLSSAETENARIKASLKSQLQGLVTEWERFANIQGNRGFAQSLGGITEAFHNLLKIANAPGLNWLTTIFLGTVTAVGARLAITASSFKAAADSGNLFSRTGDRLKSVWAATLETMDQVIARGGRLTRATDAFAQRRFTAGRGNFDNAAQMDAERMARSKFGLGGTTQLAGLAAMQRGLGALQMTVGSLSRGLALLIVSLRTLGVWLAVIGTVTWGINKAMNAFGFSSDDAQKKISLLTSEAEKFGAAADAAEQRARLFLTVKRAYANTLSRESGENMLKQVVPLAYPEEIGRKDQPRTKALEAEILLYHKLHNETALQTRLDQVRSDAMLEASEDRQAKFEKIRASMTARGQEIERLKNSPFNHSSGIAELEKQQNASKRESVQLLEEENASAEQFLATNVKYLGQLEAQKKALTSLAAIYSDLPGIGHFGEGQNEMSGTKSSLEQNERQRADLMNRQKQISDQLTANEEAANQSKVMEDEYRDLARRIDPLRVRPSAMSLGEGGLEQPTFYPRAQAAIDMEARAEEERAKQAELKARRAQLESQASIPKKLLEKNEEAKTTLQSDLEGMKAEQQNRKLRDRYSLAGQMAGFRAVESDVGETEAEKALNRRKGLMADIAKLQQDFAAAAGDGPRQDIIRVQIATQLMGIERANMDIVRQRSELRQKETQRAIDLNRELQRALLLNGPEELLKNLAAFQLTGGKQGKVSMGQFLSLSPDLKKAVSVYDQRYDPETREIRQAQNRLGPNQSFDQVNAERERIATAIAEINAQITPMGSNMSIAAQGAKELASAAANAALYLMRLSELPGIIDGIAQAARGLFSGKVGMSYDAGTMPPQAGGVLGGGVPAAVPH